jgi:hypothetical protein
VVGSNDLASERLRIRTTITLNVIGGARELGGGSMVMTSKPNGLNIEKMIALTETKVNRVAPRFHRTGAGDPEIPAYPVAAGATQVAAQAGEEQAGRLAFRRWTAAKPRVPQNWADHR